MECEYCICIQCEKEFGTDKEKCMCHKCKADFNGDGVGYCKKYWEMRNNTQLKMF